MQPACSRRRAVNIRGWAFDAPSLQIRFKLAFLQNTLDQALIGICAHWVFSKSMTRRALALVVVTTALFAVGRITFYRGYPQGAAACAFRIVTTVMPTMLELWAMGRAAFAL